MRLWEEFMIAFLLFGLDSDLREFILANKCFCPRAL